MDRLLDAAKTGDTDILHRMIQDDKYDVDTRGPEDPPYVSYRVVTSSYTQCTSKVYEYRYWLSCISSTKSP